MTAPDTTTQHPATQHPGAPAHASNDVLLPAPKARGVSYGLVIALIIAALGIGFAVGSLLA